MAAELRQRVHVLLLRVGVQRAQVARGGDQHAGLLLDDLHVVLNRVLTISRPHGLAHLASDQLAEGVREVADRVGTQAGEDLRGHREQVIAGEDRHRVTPARVRGLRTAAAVGLVHDVVVVERRKVCQLHDHGGIAHLAGRRVLAVLRGEQRKHHAKALAASQRKVADLIGNEALTLAEAPAQEVLRLLQPRRDAVVELGIPQVRSYRPGVVAYCHVPASASI